MPVVLLAKIAIIVLIAIAVIIVLLHVTKKTDCTSCPYDETYKGPPEDKCKICCGTDGPFDKHK